MTPISEPRILLVGAGELGSRHLQSLVTLDNAVIDILEPSAQSTARAKARAEAVSQHAKVVSYFDDVSLLAHHYHVIVVATSAAVRFEVTMAVLAHCDTLHVLFEKVLFQRLADLRDMESFLRERHIRAFVNCPRRLYSLYRRVEDMLSTSPLQVTVAGADWGLACNSIHFIDLAAMLSDEKLHRVDCTGLGKPLPSKRKGYQELMGTMVCRFERGSTLTLQCESDPAKYNTYSVVIRQGGHVLSIDEATGRVFDDVSHSHCVIDDGRPPFQSEMTADIVKNLLQSGVCGLPTYVQSRLLHEKMIEAMLPRFDLPITPESACPVT